MDILLVQIDGSLPNLALMRIAAHHRAIGDSVQLRRSIHGLSLFDRPDCVYVSVLFERSRPLVEALIRVYPHAIIGGTGYAPMLTLADVGIGEDRPPDYSIYPEYTPSIGYTQRGCRFHCPFCIVPTKEGAVSEAASISDIWRGPDHARKVVLLDNDFFGQHCWADRIEELRAGRFRVCFTQGVNARTLTDETAAALASVHYSDAQFQTRRLYTAWDNRRDEARLFSGLEALVRHGVKPDHIMVYMLVGYWPGETHDDREHRRRALRAFGCRPYPMPYVRTPELIAYQRWVIRRADLTCTWADFAAAHYRPERVRVQTAPLFEVFA